MNHRLAVAIVSPFALAAASCGAAPAGENAIASASAQPFAVQDIATFDEPWAMAIDPGTGTIFVTGKKGSITFVSPDGKTRGTVTGVPKVAYGGQGGLGDIDFAPGPARNVLDRRTIYLTWAEDGEADTRGAALGKGELVCSSATACAIEGLAVIWRQQPKVSGAALRPPHRVFPGRQVPVPVFGRSGRVFDPGAGSVGQPRQGIAVAARRVTRTGQPVCRPGRRQRAIWSYGHRNLLGLEFDAAGRLWDLEHGPRGGDELNLVKPGLNYGWPLVSDGDHYDGRKIRATPPGATLPPRRLAGTR